MLGCRISRLFFFVLTSALLVGCATPGGSQPSLQGLSEARLERKIEARVKKDSFPTASESGL